MDKKKSGLCVGGCVLVGNVKGRGGRARLVSDEKMELISDIN
jgi:hypothetical protein